MPVLKLLAFVASVLWTVPLRLEIQITLGKAPAYAAVCFVYGIPFSFQGKLSVKKKKNKSKKSVLTAGEWALLARKLKTAASFFRTEIRGRLGLEDAAQTALFSGALQAALSGLAYALCIPAVCRVTPDFRNAGVVLEIRCILCLRGGDIIRITWAALKMAARQKGKGKNRWTGIPLNR